MTTSCKIFQIGSDWKYFMYSENVNRIYIIIYQVKIGKAIPVTCRGGPLVCETSRLSHFLDSRLTDDGEVVSLMRRPSFIPKENSWYVFLLEAESTQGWKDEVN
jgi:hypothetical protein